MTDTEKRIKIAEKCGLDPVVLPVNPRQCRLGHDGDWFSPDAAEQMRKTFPRGAAPKVIPDYLSDLNAMHEAEKNLTPTQCETYLWHLTHDTPPRNNDKDEYWASGLGSIETYVLHATARQRADAFLRTIGEEL